MKYRVLLAPERRGGPEAVRAHDRARVRSELKKLELQPTTVRRSRIKRLRGMKKPEYRLRVGDVRVFYDVVEGPEPTVEVLAIVSKKEATVWLEREERKS